MNTLTFEQEKELQLFQNDLQFCDEFGVFNDCNIRRFANAAKTNPGIQEYLIKHKNKFNFRSIIQRILEGEGE